MYHNSFFLLICLREIRQCIPLYSCELDTNDKTKNVSFYLDQRVKGRQTNIDGHSGGHWGPLRLLRRSYQLHIKSGGESVLLQSWLGIIVFNVTSYLEHPL